MIKIPGKIPIYIHPFFWVLCLLIGYVNSGSILGLFVWGLVIFVSVLVHEYGHALTALAFGQSSTITLFALGGLTERRQDTPLKTWQECLVIANGPIAGLLLCYLSYLLLHWVVPASYPTIMAMLNVSFVVNLFWTVLNLFPVQPLDGGKLLMLIMSHFFGINGVKISLLVSIVVAIVAAALLFFIHSLIGGALFIMFGYESFRALQEAGQFSKTDQDSQVQSWIEEARGAEQRGDSEMAIVNYQRVIDGTTRGLLHQEALVKLAKLAYSRGEIDQAWELVQRAKETTEVLALKNRILMSRHDYKLALKIGETLFRQLPNFDTAMQNAFAASLGGQADVAVGWLARAQEMAQVPLEHLIRHSEFDAIRQTAAFTRFVAKNR